MQVRYSTISIYTGQVDFPFEEGDHVTIVIRYWGDGPLRYYNGHITKLSEERNEFRVKLDGFAGIEDSFNFSAFDYPASSLPDGCPIINVPCVGKRTFLSL